MSHIYPIRGVFYLPSIDSGPRDHKFKVSSEQHPAGIFSSEGVWKTLGSPPGDQIQDLQRSQRAS